MKIFLIIPTLRQGGAERVMSELANEFIKHNHEVHLILLVKSELFYTLNSKIEITNFGFENKGTFVKIFSEVKTFQSFRRLLKKERPDVVLSFMDKYNVFTILASRFLNLKVFVSDRGNPKKIISSYIHFLKKRTYKYADGIVAQTNLAKTILEKATQNHNIKVISNPVKIIQKYPLIKREKIIINVGRLVPEKGQSYLIEAFSRIEDPSWRLIILGEGPLRQNLQDQVKTLKIANRVSIPGAVLNVDEWLAKASIFAFPSISEGFPNALVEAMAAGLPCVSFDCDAGPRDIIENGKNGFLVPNKDVKQLYQKLELFKENEELRNRIGCQAMNIATELNVKKIAKLYQDFLSQR